MMTYFDSPPVYFAEIDSPATFHDVNMALPQYSPTDFAASVSEPQFHAPDIAMCKMVAPVAAAY